MADKPIIFSAPMIQALLDGRKTRRRIYARKGEDRNAPEHLAKRLANGLDDAPEDGCWEWQRTRSRDGYGTLTINGRAAYAHRLAYELSKGAIPDGMDVMHSCDNPRCINPDHLSAGTRNQNMADCHARGRSRIPTPRLTGESNGSAKLTKAKVAVIRDGLAAGVTQQQLADRFGVSQSLIGKISRGEIWND